MKYTFQELKSVSSNENTKLSKLRQLPRLDSTNLAYVLAHLLNICCHIEGNAKTI